MVMCGVEFTGATAVKPAYDSTGRQIHVGDLLKTYHFASRLRRAKQFLYHVVTLNESRDCLEAIPYEELTGKRDGGRFWLHGWCDKQLIVAGMMINGRLHNERKRITKQEFEAR